MLRRKPIFREIFNSDLGGGISSGVTWTLERRALECYESCFSLWKSVHVQEPVPHKHNHIIGVYTSADGALTAAVGSNGQVRVHEPADVDDSFRVDLTLPGAIAATWGDNDRLYVALPYRAKVWRFDLESCESDKPSHQLVLPDHERGTAAPTVSDMTFIAPHVLATSMSNGMAFIVDDRMKRSAVNSVRVTSISGTSKPPAITSTTPLLITGARGYVNVYDIRRLPPANYTNALSQMRTMGGGGKSDDSSSGTLTSLRVMESSADFGTIHVTPGCRTSVAFQLASGHAGYVDLLGVGRTKVKMECTTPRPVTSSESELQTYGTALHSSAIDSWWVHRRRATITTAPYGEGWRLFAPLVHSPGFRVIAMGANEPSQVQVVKTRKKVTSVCALRMYGGCPSVAVGYSQLDVDLLRSERRKNDDEDTTMEETPSQ